MILRLFVIHKDSIWLRSWQLQSAIWNSLCSFQSNQRDTSLMWVDQLCSVGSDHGNDIVWVGARAQEFHLNISSLSNSSNISTWLNSIQNVYCKQQKCLESNKESNWHLQVESHLNSDLSRVSLRQIIKFFWKFFVPFEIAAKKLATCRQFDSGRFFNKK